MQSASTADPRARPAPRRAARALATALIVAGSLLVADAVTTLLWQEPVTALYAALKQDRLNAQLHRVETRTPSAATRRALAAIPDEKRRIALLARRMQAQAAPGSAVGRIVIPRIGASFVLVAGTGTEELRSGPGIYPQTVYPGIPGTTAIAGHRTTFLAPFRHIDQLAAGDTIRVEMPYAHFTYTVLGQRVVQPDDVRAATAAVGYTRLVLSACTPLFTAEKRLLVFARLTRTVPEGAARRLPGGAAATPILASA